MNKPSIEEWKKEFKKKFSGLFSLYTAEEINEEVGAALFERKYEETVGKEVVDFIQSLLEAQKEKDIKEFKEMVNNI